jgi:hypothetical protein
MLGSRRANNWVLWLSGLVLLAGTIAILVVVFGNEHGSTPPVGKNEGPPQLVKVPKTVQLAPGAVTVARQFILTAAQRKNMAKAWLISGPGIRQGMTRKQFLTGNIAVQPVFGKIDGVSYKIVYSYPRKAEIESAVYIHQRNGSSKGFVFFIAMSRLGSGTSAHWVVDSFVPDVPIPVPANPNQ